MAPLSQIPTNILQSMQAARQQARADAALQLQQDQFALTRETEMRRRELQDIDRDLGMMQDPAYGPTTSATTRGGRTRGRSGPAYGDIGSPTAARAQGLTPKERAALGGQIAQERQAIGSVGDLGGYIAGFGRGEVAEQDLFGRQQAELEDFRGRRTDFRDDLYDWAGGGQGEQLPTRESALMGLLGGEGALDFPELRPEEGTAFRSWVRENYPDYAGQIDLSARGPTASPHIQKAWEQYGGEYTRGDADRMFRELLFAGSPGLPEGGREALGEDYRAYETEDLVSGRLREGLEGAESRTPDEIVEDLQTIYTTHLEAGGAPLSEDVLTDMVGRAWLQGPAPEQEASGIEEVARGFLTQFGGQQVSREDARRYFVDVQGAHPATAELLIEKVQDIGSSPEYLERRALQDAGLLEAGAEILTAEDIELNPASKAGLSAEYAQTPNLFNQKVRGTDYWARDLDDQGRAELMEEYRLWYDKRVRSRQREQMSALDTHRRRREEENDRALEESIQSFMDYGRAGAAPKKIHKDEEQLRRWAMREATQDKAHMELTKQHSARVQAGIAAGPGNLREIRLREAKERAEETEDHRQLSRYNEMVGERLVGDPALRDILERAGVNVRGPDGDYLPPAEMKRALVRVRARSTKVRGEIWAGMDPVEGIALLSDFEDEVGAFETKSTAQRETKIPEPEDGVDGGGTTANEQMRALSSISAIHDRAYRRAVKDIEIGGALRERLSSAEDARNEASTTRAKRIAQLALRKVQDEVDALQVVQDAGVEHGADANLSVRDRADIDGFQRVGKLGDYASGGGGGGASSVSPGPGWIPRTMGEEDDLVWYNPEMPVGQKTRPRKD